MGFFSVLLKASGVFAVYLVGTWLYNLYLHPLAKYPGPVFWRASRLGYMKSLWSGWLHRDVKDLHRQYGDIIRIAPNELSFARTDAFHDIYSNRGAAPAFPKSLVWHDKQPGRPMSVLNAIDPKVHARFRRAIDPGFTERAVLTQESIVQEYVGKFISKIRSMADANPDKTAVVNVVQWYNYVTFDLIGDLGFGEPFGCLDSEGYHPWMAIIFNSLKAATQFATLRFYSPLDTMLQAMMPASVKKMADEHWQLAVDKLDRRLKLEKDRPDLISPVIKRNKEVALGEGLELGELQATASLIIVAGSETTVTTISGITNNLVRNPDKLAKLTQEVRERFPTEDAITLTALKSLPYLQAVINEGLRLCNPTPVGVPRIVPSGGGTVSGHFLPPDTFVNVHPLALSLDPKKFHDANAFQPERWLDAAKTNPKSPFYNDDLAAVQAFGVGPRSCVGKPLAWAELRLILARVVWAFDLQQADTPNGVVDWDSQITWTVIEKKPFDVKMVLRKV
ncbi:cytochrome P450 [Melanomma pulvis-pyrius CBS 109.77]|uniref:Cytochrome P450 n=1 Tax=Melanomma pulvis-pyrius CBS 109.77 TaxID=1314802 RepID=A0A6A6WUL8_9PLEO|nr:cytochrome P450 [Melanomma pulvis-pyrius CBS 109.77]